ncbi:hypothetical protein B566_EDAN008689 [Ephemera danica]|nr:hypothetical protein B566_EDAN008689 [Ephemera danica]
MEKMKTDLAQDYSEYLKIDIHEEITNLEETIEDMLTRLEEFESLMEGVHSEGTSNIVQAVPEIQCSCQALEGLFNRVDHIEALVCRVRKDLACMETRLDTAETETGSSSLGPDLGLRGLLKPLFSKKIEVAPVSSVKSPTYEPPDIFRTEQFFPPPPSEN